MFLPSPVNWFILCSDGVTDGVDNDTLAPLLHENDAPQQAAQAIVYVAQSGGSKDNITCIVLHVTLRVVYE